MENGKVTGIRSGD